MKNYVLKIEKKSFADKNDITKTIVYYALSTEVDGVKINLSISQNDKKLANHLLSKHNYDDKGNIVD